MSRALVIVLLAGCGFRITSGSNGGDGGGSDDASTTDDGGPGDGDMIDGAIDAPIDGPIANTCILPWLNHSISFSTPVQIATLTSTSYDRDAFVSVDELTIWFSNGGATSQGGGDVFKATRSNRTLPFGPSARDPDFSTSGGVESKMAMMSNQLFAVVASSQSGGAGGSDIWETSRATATSSWGALTRTHVMSLDTSASELDPFVTPDGMHLYYAPTTPAPQRIMVAKRTNLAASFASVIEVANINTTAGESDPTLFANDLVIVFSSDRASQNGSGNIWYATRTQSDGEFGTPIELPGMSSDLDDADAHVSADGCRIYFSRNVGGGVDWELFSASAN